MLVIVLRGRVRYFGDSGKLANQTANLAALIGKIQTHAADMQVIAANALSVDPQLVSLNRALQHQVKTLQGTLSTAERQIKRNGEEKNHA